MEVQAKITKNSGVVDEFVEKLETPESMSDLLTALKNAKLKTNEMLTQLVSADKLDPIASKRVEEEAIKGM